MTDDTFNQPDSEAAFEAKRLLRIRQLADLRPDEYGMVRSYDATMLGISPVELLDEMVASMRPKDATGGNPPPRHWTVEPWADAVDGASLLDDIRAMFCRHVVMPHDAQSAAALWVMHAWTHDAGDISPHFVLKSPTKRCGKTNALTVLHYLTPRSVLAGNVSSAAIYRFIEAGHPTLLIDEAETFVNNEQTRGILDAGHTKPTAYVLRCDGDDHEPKPFSVWAPKAIACIGKMATTLEDRSIIVPMIRKLKTDKVQRLRLRDNPEYAVLRSRCARWAADNMDKLADPDPELPGALNDRAQDNWRPLVAIADLAGPEWGKRARTVALALSGEDVVAEEEMAIELLRDLALAFKIRANTAVTDKDKLTSKDFHDHLMSDEDRPWASYGKAHKPISPRQIGRLLGSFGIKADSVRVGKFTPKGYELSKCQSTIDAYFPISPPLNPEFLPQHPQHADEMGTSRTFSSATNEACCGNETSKKPNNDGHVADVAAKKLGIPRGTYVAGEKGAPVGGGPIRIRPAEGHTYKHVNADAPPKPNDSVAQPQTRAEMLQRMVLRNPDPRRPPRPEAADVASKASGMDDHDARATAAPPVDGDDDDRPVYCASELRSKERAKERARAQAQADAEAEKAAETKKTKDVNPLRVNPTGWVRTAEGHCVKAPRAQSGNGAQAAKPRIERIIPGPDSWLYKKAKAKDVDERLQRKSKFRGDGDDRE